jgi:hypothetical protein
MKSSLVIAAIASAWGGVAFAQDVPPEGDAPPEAEALRLTIRPSSVQETSAERLARRTEQLDFAFRFICRGCSSVRDPAKAGLAPFNPADVLAKRPKSASEPR